MSERTGLGPVELALLTCVEKVTSGTGLPRRTTRVLDLLETEERIGWSYGLQALQDLGSPWKVDLRLFDLEGNWGSGYGDLMADPPYTEVGLSALGALALAAERGEVGPIPLSLVNGSAYCGGRVPPLDPARTLALLTAGGLDDVDLGSLVRLPTGGLVVGGLADLVAGRPARVTCTCPILRERTGDRDLLVIAGAPMGVVLDEIASKIAGRASYRGPWAERSKDFLPRPDPVVATIEDIRDEGTGWIGDRIVVTLRRGADVDAAEAWLRAIWPVTIEVDWQIPGGLLASLTTWAERCRPDPSGLQRLVTLL